MRYFLLLFVAALFAMPSMAQDSRAGIDSLLRVSATGPDTVRVMALAELCRLYRTSDPENAIRYGKEGVALALEAGYNDGEYKCRQALGNAHIVSGDFANAMRELLLARGLSEEMGDRKREAACLSNIAIIHLNLGSLQKALENHTEALAIREELHDSVGIANSLNNLGVLYTELNNPQQALENYRASLNIKQRLDLDAQLGVNLNNIAISHQELGDSLLALDFYKSALENYRKHGNLDGEAMVLGNLGQLTDDSGYLRDALRLYDRLGNDEGRCLSHLHLSKWHLQRNAADMAMIHADSAMHLAENTGSLKLRRDAHLRMSEVFDHKGNKEKSLRHLQTYLEQHQAMQMEETSQRMAELQTVLETERIERELDLLVAENRLNIERIESEKKVGRITLALLALALMLVALAAYAYWRKKADNRVLEQKNHIIGEKNTSIMQSIRYAKRIQKAVLSTETRLQQVFSKSMLLFRPKDIVSGDFFWADSRGDWDYLAVSDCTGHGVPGAFVSILGHTELAKALDAASGQRPDQMIEMLNERIRQTLRNEQSSEVSDGMDIALCAINRRTHVLEFCGAHRPLVIVSKSEKLTDLATVTAGENGFLHLIAGSRRPVGKTDRDIPFARVSVQLSVGDRLYLFSDGFTDQFGGDKDKKFGNRRFRDMLLDSAAMPLDQQLLHVEKCLNEWMAGRPQTDDICVAGIEAV